MEWIFITVCLMFLGVLRIIYIMTMIEDWNNYLRIYISKMENMPIWDREYSIDYLKIAILNPYRYILRLNCWTIDSIISDKSLINKINEIIDKEYS